MTEGKEGERRGGGKREGWMKGKEREEENREQRRERKMVGGKRG